MNRHKLALPIIVSFSIVGQIQPVSPQQAPPPYGGPPPQQAPPPYGGPPPIYANPSRSVGAAPGAQETQGAPGAAAPGQSAQSGNFCATAQGRFGPGPVQPLGTVCSVNMPGGSIFGQVSR
jgi:hypothetical protein